MRQALTTRAAAIVSADIGMRGRNFAFESGCASALTQSGFIRFKLQHPRLRRFACRRRTTYVPVFRYWRLISTMSWPSKAGSFRKGRNRRDLLGRPNMGSKKRGCGNRTEKLFEFRWSPLYLVHLSHLTLCRRNLSLISDIHHSNAFDILWSLT